MRDFLCMWKIHRQQNAKWLSKLATTNDILMASVLPLTICMEGWQLTSYLLANFECLFIPKWISFLFFFIISLKLLYFSHIRSLILFNIICLIISSHNRFWCHFDDDNYVNIPTLVKLLNEYHASHDWYLGKPSISSPIEISLNAVSWLLLLRLLL